MDPLIRQLQRYQGRERAYRLTWGLARWIGVLAAGLLIACLVDWLIDRYRDTPFGLRVVMTLLQAVALIAAGYAFVVKLGVPALDDLASRAEQAFPEFDHRIVTALQLNRPQANTRGMSPELIADVTREAITLAERRDFAQLAERERVRRAAQILAPVGLVTLLLVLFQGPLVRALVARQLLLDVPIPRSVSLSNTTPELWPSGDAVRLTFDVRGEFRPELVGSVQVVPVDQPPETYELKFAHATAEGAVFAADLPPSSSAFRFTAWLRDGRTRVPGVVRFEPRPVVKEVSAWLQLPLYVDPAGQRRYERYQPEGEVTALPGCGLRIEATASKPLTQARLVLLTRDSPRGDGPRDNGPRGEPVNPRGGEAVGPRGGAVGGEIPLGPPIDMQLSADRQTASVQFEIPPQASAYRILVSDANAFANLNPPRRGISMAPDEPPRVSLLPEVLKDPRDPGPIDDYEVTGMPLVLGGRVQIGYAARSPLGLSRAAILYRVNDAPTWTPLPLKLTVADPMKLGAFLPELGVFENSGPFGQVEFYPIPSPDPAEEPPGLEAGGRYNFETAALKKLVNGRETKLEIGDRVEFYVAVYDRNPDPNRPPGRSESRIKAVVSQLMLEDWTRQRDQSRERLKQLEERQRGVFRQDG